MPSLPDQRLRFGCCGSMISPADPVGGAIIEELARLGFDYVELSLRDLTALPEPDFAALAARLARSGLRCEACNNFFPPEIRLTGPAADRSAALRHADAALARAAQLGVAMVVFGSSASRNVPAGFPPAAAREQLRELLAALGPRAAAHGVTIVIEPLNRGESNIVNSIAEAARLARAVGHPQVQMLADAYHLLLEQEPTAVILETSPALRHVHLAQGRDRVFPSGGDPALADFFAALRAAGYRGRCSIEAYTRDFAADAARALEVLRALAGAGTVQ